MDEAHLTTVESAPKPAVEALAQIPPPPAFENRDAIAEIPHHVDGTTSVEVVAAATARINKVRDTLLATEEDRSAYAQHLREKIAQKQAAGEPSGAYERALAKLDASKQGVAVLEHAAPTAANEDVVEAPAPLPSVDELNTTRYGLEQRAAKLTNGIYSPMLDGNLKAASDVVRGAEARVRQAKVGENAVSEVPQREVELQQALGKYVEQLKNFVTPREQRASQAAGAEGVAAQHKSINAKHAEAAPGESARRAELMAMDPFDVTIEYMTALKKIGGVVPASLEMLKADVDSGKRMGLSEKDMQSRYAVFLEALEKSGGDQQLAA